MDEPEAQLREWARPARNRAVGHDETGAQRRERTEEHHCCRLPPSITEDSKYKYKVESGYSVLRSEGNTGGGASAESDQVIRENPASRGTETSAEVLVGPPWRMKR